MHRRRNLLWMVLALGWLGVAAAPAVAADAATRCATLASRALPQTVYTTVEAVPAGGFHMPADGGPHRPVDTSTVPAFCRIAATLHPSSDSDIRVEVWMPLAGWNGKLIGVGSGGLAGNIAYAGQPEGLIDAVSKGYAAATTDAGHDITKDSSPGIFLLHHPQKMIDYGYRSNHVMTVLAKALIRAFYGSDPTAAYFIGCSMGSMEAINEAWRYPGDYQGVIAGALMNPVADFNAAQLWPAELVAHDPAKDMSAAQFNMVHAAILKRCATPVGLHDGFVEDPNTCRFDPASLLCQGAQTPDCLTAKQVELLRQIYQGPVNPRTGKVIFPGPAPGAEVELAGIPGRVSSITAAPHASSLALYRYGVMGDPNWDWKSLDYDKDVTKAEKILRPDMHVTADLNPFLKRGGKLFIYIGWEDYHNPRQVMAYYDAVLKNAGLDGARNNAVRLFVVPGMWHCAGGEGCDTFDKIAAMDAWQQSGKAPDQLISTRLDDKGQVIRSRPLCAYPQVAKYAGSGDMDKAASFSCMAE